MAANPHEDEIIDIDPASEYETLNQEYETTRDDDDDSCC